ncbi:MAG: ATP-binding protein [Vicinamibacterales bacterium]
MLLLGSGVAAVLLSRDLRVRALTPAAALLLGAGDLPAGAAIATPEPALVEDLEADVVAAVRSGQGVRREVHCTAASYVRQVQPASREDSGAVVTFVDVTASRRSADAARDSQARFRDLADNIAQLAWMANGDGWIFWYNKRWHDYTGTTLAEMEGWGWRAVHHPDHVDRVVAKIGHAFQTGEVWEDTFPLRGADGRYRWFLSRAIPIRDEQGRVVRWFGTNTDITELRDAEARLMQAARQKDEFLAMLGPELRNPLAAIRSASDVLRLHAPEDTAVVAAQQVLSRQTAHMARLLDALLDVSRIISGKIALENTVVDLGAICREVASDQASRAEARGVTLRRRLPAAPVWVDGDPVRLAQVVDNLLSNAVKYSRPGDEVLVALGRDGADAVLRVVDVGVGIEPDLLPHVFEPFRQSPQSLDRSEGGLGLGLSLVKALTELHGGRATAHSAGLGLGSEFVIRLPQTDRRPAPAAAVGPVAAGGRRVLLIEDNEDGALMLREALTRAGHEVEVARDGRRGVEAAFAGVPDVVICDLGLPAGLTGFDVARSLRGHDATRAIRLYALSGYARPEDKARCADAGFDGHFSKPVDLDHLLQVIARPA